MPTAAINDGTRIAAAGTIQENIETTAAAYRLTLDTRYRDRAVSELMNAASFADWNPKKHFLDTAAIMRGMAIGYDWLYDELTDSQRRTVSGAIYEKGLIPALNQHKSPYCNFNWTGNKTNWNFVCNSAVTIAALAVGDISGYEETCGELVSLSLKSMQGTIKRFGSDGSWYESPEYGRYGMSYFYPATEAMRTALGTDYGYGDFNSINSFCDYIIYISGGRSVFNYGDGGETLISFNGHFLASERTGNDLYGAYRIRQLENTTADVMDVLWYDSSFKNVSLDAASKDRAFSDNETATFRNDFFGSYSMGFAGLHGGRNSDTHCQLDAGSFVYDAYGMRYGCDLGQQSYDAAHIWTTDVNAAKNRWGYYRNRAESHNTLVINPDSGADQNPDAEAEMIAYGSEKDYGYAAVNLTDVYKDDVTAAKRGIWFDRRDCSLLVQDELTLKKQSDVYWFMTYVHGPSSAFIEIAPDGKSAVITRENKRVWVGILQGEGVFEAVDAAPMSTSPNPDLWEENIKSGVKQSIDTGWYGKLQLKLTDVSGDQRIVVYMCPIGTYQTKPSTVPAITSIDDWK